VPASHRWRFLELLPEPAHAPIKLRKRASNRGPDGPPHRWLIPLLPGSPAVQRPAGGRPKQPIALPPPNKQTRPRATSAFLPMLHPAQANTFRKPSSLVFHLPEVRASSTAATFNRGMQRTREDFLKIHRFRAVGHHPFSAPAFSAFLYKLGRPDLITAHGINMYAQGFLQASSEAANRTLGHKVPGTAASLRSHVRKLLSSQPHSSA
jgi:hypothetical protein